MTTNRSRLIATATDLIGDDVEHVDPEYVRAMTELITNATPDPEVDHDVDKERVRALITTRS